ncbi:MAG: hypothetical protein JWQ97_3547 [Phenylobacterium sp.]|nr:hypothetical protein [Phenylobacterium sp.]
MLDAYMGAADQCLRGRARYLLFSGLRSRTAIERQANAMCTPSLRRALVEIADLTASQADAAVETMSYRVIDEMLAEAGAAH